MDRLKNPALWCAFVVLSCAAVIHGGVWPDGDIHVKLLTILSEIAGGAGSLFWGAGLGPSISSGPPAPPPGTVLRGGVSVLALLFLGSLMACAGATKYQVARGTFASIRQAEVAYRAWAEQELPALTLKARAECKGDKACVDRVAGKTFAAVEKTNASLLIYHQVERGAAACLGASGDLQTCIAEAVKVGAVAAGNLGELGFAVKKGGN